MKVPKLFRMMLPVLLACGFNRAWGLDGVINVKLPNNVSYDLEPIKIELGVTGDSNPELTLNWHVFERNGACFPDFIPGPWSKNGAQGLIPTTFTPSQFGWYTLILNARRNGKIIGGWQKHIGVTPRYPGMAALLDGDLRPGRNNEPLHSFCGLLLDRVDTGMSFEDVERVLAEANKHGVTLLMQMGNSFKDPDLNRIREWVARFKGRIKYWEAFSNPDPHLPGAVACAELLKQIYPMIKSADPDAVVVGPAAEGLNLLWYDAFYHAAGGKFVDALSFHDSEGHGTVDIFHWTYKLTEVRKIMARYGDTNKPLWQTGRSFSSSYLGFIGPAQAARMTLQCDVLEAFGVSHNILDGCEAGLADKKISTTIFSESGPYPAALALRTRCAMIQNRVFAERLDFGPTGNKIFLGLRYKGADGETITLRNFGCLDLPLEVSVNGGDVIDMVDTWGDAIRIPVDSGRAKLMISQVPRYIRLTKDQSLTVPPIDYGKNMAFEATYTYSQPTNSNPKILYDHVFQSYYPSSPWGSEWQGRYAGKIYNEKPEHLDISFETPRLIDKLLIFSDRADNSYSALLDYDLQYRDGEDWKTLEEVRTPCPPSDPVQSYMSKVSMWYQDNNFFVQQFKKPVYTDRLRLTVRRITRGCMADMIAEDVNNEGKSAEQRWHASAETIQFREIEIYGPPPDVEISGHARAASLAGLQEREPLTITVTNRTGQPLNAIAKVKLPLEMPGGWTASPAELNFKAIGANETQEQKLELVAPALIMNAALPVQLDLTNEKGDTLHSRWRILDIPAPFDLHVGNPSVDESGSPVFPLTIVNLGAQQPALGGDAELQLSGTGTENVQVLMYSSDINLSALKTGESRTLNFKAERVKLAQSDWVAEFVVMAGKFRQTTFVSRWAWQAVGPFPYEKGDFDKANEPETEVNLRKTYTVAGEKTAGWKPALPDANNCVDLYQLFDPHDNVCAYAVTYLNSPCAEDVIFSTGCDDGIKVWLNGKIVQALDTTHAAHRASDHVIVSLKEGWNEVLVKVTQGSGGWGFYFDLDGLPGNKPLPVGGVSHKPE